MQKAVPKYHPIATSAAAEAVKKHEKPANIVLWAGWFCPFTQRSWVVLEELGITYQYKEVVLTSWTEISPKGLTPGLQVNGKPLHDSAIINEFLNEEYGSSKLMPEEPYQRAIARLWIEYIKKRVLSTVSRESKGPYFFGGQFSLVDATIVPWAVRDFIVREFRGFVRDDVQRWSARASALEARGSVVRTTSGKSEMIEFNGTFLRNELHSLAGRAAADGQAIP
ncbi:glutathione S-transferase [Trichoderma velutinum]